MSWIDLAALTLILWSAAKGYISGAYVSLLHLITTTVALMAAVVLQTPLAAYLDKEWQIEEVLGSFIANQIDVAVTTFSQKMSFAHLPQLAGEILFRMVPELAAVPVAGGEMSAFLLTQLVIRIFCVGIFFLLVAALATLLIRLGQQNSPNALLPEWQKIIGLVIGSVHGFLLAAIICIALDAVSFMSFFRIFQQDLDSSYLYQLDRKSVV